ncbi:MULTISPECIES: Y-family DNA polymerase [Salinibacter]|uniref:Y-family DNA polymerase n=1 Tax=Salinibacter TaxID=146918 RepID=UPI0021E79F4A|nr:MULTISPECIES: Y-family DNA polymerase [Salinibacter]
MDSVIALIDCQAFYVSCERVFDPALRGRPTVVLSNNDGCAIARSAAVKAAGVPMGAPVFKWRDELEAMDAAVLSSNYALYADLSRRVAAVLETMSIDLERYSIDECFVTLPALDRDALRALGERIRRRVRDWVGIPVRVAIGPTKSLAKIADEKAKADKRAGDGTGVYVCPPEPDLDVLLSRTDVGDVWGIGPSYEETLREHGVTTAAEFRALPDPWLRSTMTVVGLRLARELRGQRCLDLDLVGPDRQSLVRSRSFGAPVEAKAELRQALAKHAQRAAEKLREEDLVARGISAFITTKTHGPPPHYADEAQATLDEHTAAASPFVRSSRRLLDVLYRAGPAYRKAGVMLYAIRPRRPHQGSLFGRPLQDDEALMQAVDRINGTMGRGTIGVAAAGLPGDRDWTMTRDHTSPRYTTRWDELPVARA